MLSGGAVSLRILVSSPIQPLVWRLRAHAARHELAVVITRAAAAHLPFHAPGFSQVDAMVFSELSAADTGENIWVAVHLEAAGGRALSLLRDSARQMDRQARAVSCRVVHSTSSIVLVLLLCLTRR